MFSLQKKSKTTGRHVEISPHLLFAYLKALQKASEILLPVFGKSIQD